MEAGGGSFCQLLERTIAQICQPFFATRSMENGCVLLPVEGSEGILLPPVQHDPVLSVEDPAGRGGDNFNSSILAKSALVPDSNGNDGGDPQASLPQRETAYIPNGRPASADEELINQTNRMEALRSSLESRGLPKNVIELLLGAARLITQSAYQSAWNAWNSWCIKRGVHSMSAAVNDVLSFLAEYFSEGRSYSSVNIARSMLSSTLCLGPNNIADIGKYPLVVKLMKGIYNQKPPKPRYITTWDPSVVLAFFDVSATIDPSLIQISRKAATLIALTSMLRGGEIASIQLPSINFSDLQISFTLGNPRKTQRSGPLHQIFIQSWPQNPAICPVQSIDTYINKTASLRNETNKSHLFISSTKPHKPVTSSTIGRWIKDQLREAGIDTSIFSAHSTRGAAGSKAFANGVPLKSILNQGHWARESTFAKFYQRDVNVDRNVVGQSVLQVSDSEE